MSTHSRRTFLKTSLSATAPLIVPSSVLGLAGQTPPSDRVVVGQIGVGSRGSYILRTVLEQKEAQVVAVCDVKSDCRAAAADMVNGWYENKDCATYNEFEELVGRNDIDACVVASCDHWHVLHALAAVRSGKDVYLEKPMGLSVEQDQTLRKAVRENKRVFQFGTQQRSDEKFRLACELVRNGRIGTLRDIYVWAPPSVSGGPLEQAPVPATLDYDRWLGPAPFTPYTTDRETNAWWWFISDYALGFIAGWGIHPIDIAVWGAGSLLETPVTVEGTGDFPSEGLCNTATNWDIRLKYDSGVTIHFHGAPAPPEWAGRYPEISEHGTAFHGDAGWVQVDRSRIQTSPETLREIAAGSGEIKLNSSDHHVRNYIECVRSRKDPVSDIETAVQGDIICQISDIAIRLGRPVRWDTLREQFVDDPEASQRLTRAMRDPWRL